MAFTHNCEQCKSLGEFTYEALVGHSSKEKTVDLYHCPGELGGSVIARFSDEPSGYASGDVETIKRLRDRPTHSTYSPALIEALRRMEEEFISHVDNRHGGCVEACECPEFVEDC